MNLTRRGLLGILAAGFAPAAIGSGVLMPIRYERPFVLWGDGIHDDTKAFQAWADGARVLHPSGAVMSSLLSGSTVRISGTIDMRNSSGRVVRGNSFIGSEMQFLL